MRAHAVCEPVGISTPHQGNGSRLRFPGALLDPGPSPPRSRTPVPKVLACLPGYCCGLGRYPDGPVTVPCPSGAHGLGRRQRDAKTAQEVGREELYGVKEDFTEGESKYLTTHLSWTLTSHKGH